MKLPQFYLDQVITRALQEDLSYLDVTTDLLLPPDHQGQARLIAKQAGVICGMDIAMRVFEVLDPTQGVAYEIQATDGTAVQAGDVLATMSGDTATLLKGERTALNFLQHLSGIATETSACVALTAGTKASIVCTRKTLPGLRALQKYAVLVGGGRNHRYNLSDAAMLKDNHIDAYGSLSKAVTALRERLGHMVMIEVEVRTLDELEEALTLGVPVIMLDNMTCEQMAEAVKRTNGRAVLEASGNLTRERIAAVAATGVDILSIGGLTHSVRAFDISMQW